MRLTTHGQHARTLGDPAAKSDKVENPARFFNYELAVQNNIATWVRNAMLTTRVGLAVVLMTQNKIVRFTPVALWSLLLGASLMILFSLSSYFAHTKKLKELLPKDVLEESGVKLEVHPILICSLTSLAVGILDISVECLLHNPPS